MINMNKFLAVITALAVALFASNSFAWNPPASPAPASWISDTSEVLSSAAHARLDAQLTQINQSSANELAALIVPSLEGEDISDVTNATFKAWGVGKKGLDNGVLVVLAMKEHKSRIETGKGIEGDLPDLKTQDILTQVVRPHMKRGDVEGALSASFTAISSSIANHKAEAAASILLLSSCDVGSVGATGGVSFFILACLALMFVAFAARARQRRKEEERILQQSARLAAANRAEAARKLREAQAKKASAPKPVVVVAPKPVSQPIPMPTYHPPTPIKHESHSGEVAAAAILAEAASHKASETYRHERAAEIQRANKREEEARKSKEESAARRRRDEEAAADRRRRDEESRRSDSDSSSSSWDSGSSSSDSGSFGGGDSGGGGSSSDW